MTTHYAHPVMSQVEFYERIANWVSPGGTLLIGGHLHQNSDWPYAKATTTTAAITARFDMDDWQIDVAEEHERQLDGRNATLHDVIMRMTTLRT